ncbi:hypothetical protein PMAYCL1PPCAC_01173, partial [Pristionchus mayeri]
FTRPVQSLLSSLNREVDTIFDQKPYFPSLRHVSCCSIRSDYGASQSNSLENQMFGKRMDVCVK